MARGVLLVGTDRFGETIPEQSQKKFEAFAAVAPHWVLGYSTDRRFHRRTDTVTFILCPGDLPTCFRVPVLLATEFLMASWLIVARRVDVLVSQSPYDAIPLVAARSLWRALHRRAAVIVQIQGDWEDVLPLVHPAVGRFLPWWKSVLNWAIDRADVVRTVTSGAAQRLGPGRTIITFPTWTDFDRFLAPPRPLQRDQKVVLFAGVLTPVKGVDVLLEAFATAAQRESGLQLVLAGDGPEQPSLARLAESLGIERSVRWSGHVDHEHLLTMMDECSVFVLPSRTEGLPRVILEAMARNRPVVASNVGGIPELVVDGVTGILVAPDDPSGLGEAICRVLDPAIGVAFGEQGRREVEAKFSTRSYVSSYELMLSQAIERSVQR